MEIPNNVLKNDERAAFGLRALYQKYGYRRYKMSRFEEYDLYVRNKDFLVSDGVITFTDTNGRLMALKPDVTLSIIKNFQAKPGCVQKVCYNENVYRVSSSTRGFKEILQTGLECMGDVGLYEICETVLLAVMSMRSISGRSALDVSHMGIIAAVMDGCGVPAALRGRLGACLSQKNEHGILALCAEAGLEPEAGEKLTALCRLYAPLEEGIAQLRQICPETAAGAIGELEAVAAVLRGAGCAETAFVDFSLVSDMKYYSGVTFCGYVEGVPGSVLSGGAYDNLMRKMGKNAGGIGFAVYLDQLERFGRTERKYDVDTVLLYQPEADPADVAGAVKRLTESGADVLAEKAAPEGLRYRRLLRLSGREVEELETNG